MTSPPLEGRALKASDSMLDYVSRIQKKNQEHLDYVRTVLTIIESMPYETMKAGVSDLLVMLDNAHVSPPELV